MSEQMDQAARLEQAARPTDRPNPAVEAEPAGIGSSDATDELSREVRLLGALLGQVIAEQADFPHDVGGKNNGFSVLSRMISW